jgi:hypothetical protein
MSLSFLKMAGVGQKARGRPLKFGRPAHLLALTLPRDVVGWLRRIHRDPAWAIVRLFERLSGERRRKPAAPPAVELARLSPRRALIVVDPQSIRSVPGVSVVPVAHGRAFLAFDEGRGLADLELAIAERVEDPNTSAAERQDLRRVHRQVRDWRRSRGYRFSTQSIVLVERVGRRRRRPATRPPSSGPAANGRRRGA